MSSQKQDQTLVPSVETAGCPSGAQRMEFVPVASDGNKPPAGDTQTRAVQTKTTLSDIPGHTMALVSWGSGDMSTSSDYSIYATAAPYLFDGGTNMYRERSNLEATPLASAARTLTTSTADLINHNAADVKVYLNTTNINGGSLTLTIEEKDPASGTYKTLLSGAAVTTNTLNVYKISRTLPAVANVCAQDLLPKTWRITVTPVDATAVTYSAAYALLR